MMFFREATRESNIREMFGKRVISSRSGGE